jgi:hypothetical protein
MHDEFAQLLVEGLPFDNELQVDHSLNDLDIRDSDKESLMLYKIYRKKLQNFLLNSVDYNPKRVAKFLPQQYLHENALVLSRLGRHRDVLTIYLHQLESLSLAESYCDRMYKSASDVRAKLADGMSRAQSSGGSIPKTSFASTGSSSFSVSVGTQFLEAGEIYLIMFKVIIHVQQFVISFILSSPGHFGDHSPAAAVRGGRGGGQHPRRLAGRRDPVEGQHRHGGATG